MATAAQSLPDISPNVVNGSVLRVGVSSWSERSLTHESNWYPKRSMKAAERIAFYAQRFSLVEMETTYRFPPTPEMAKQWVERTPEGFTFDLQMWGLLTCQAAMPASLWPDLVDEIQPERRDQPRLYATHLSDAALDECWARMRHALAPLVSAGKLGSVILRYPRWFVPGNRTRAQLVAVRERLGDLPAAIQLASSAWTEPESCEDTLSLLDELGLAFVNVDAPTHNPISHRGLTASSSDLGVLRLTGHKEWDEEAGWQPDARGYRYGDDELRALAQRVVHLLDCTSELHVIVSTCWRDDAVVNAERLMEFVGKAAKSR